MGGYCVVHAGVGSGAPMADTGGGSRLFQINRNRRRIEALETDPEGFTTLRGFDDLEAKYPAVNGVHPLQPDWTYHVVEPLPLGSNTLKGHNITIIGNASLQTLISTDSPNAIVASDGDGYISIEGGVFLNVGGPFLDLDLGLTPLSILRLTEIFFTGGRTAGGVGSFGRIVRANKLTISSIVMVDLDDGLDITGQVNEISMTDASLNPGLGATAFIGVDVKDTATLDIALFSVYRIDTIQAADRAMKLGTGATYTKSVQIQTCTLRGPGTFLDAAGKPKTDPFVMSFGNGEALEESLFAGEASFSGNTVATVIGGGNQGVLLPVGNGAPTHEVFVSDFSERWTLSGATTNVQKFTNNDLITRTYKIQLHCEINRAGGGTIFIGLGLALEGSTIAASVTATEVGNAASLGFTAATVAVAPGEDVTLLMSNNTSEANVIMNSATWSVHKI